MTIYAKLALTKEEFDLVRGQATEGRARMIERVATTALGPAPAGMPMSEHDFYKQCLLRYEALIAKCEAILIGDTSQDEPDVDDEDDDDEDDDEESW